MTDARMTARGAAKAWGAVALVLLASNLLFDTNFDGVIGALILSQLWSATAAVLKAIEGKQ